MLSRTWLDAQTRERQERFGNAKCFSATSNGSHSPMGRGESYAMAGVAIMATFLSGQLLPTPMSSRERNKRARLVRRRAARAYSRMMIHPEVGQNWGIPSRWELSNRHFAWWRQRGGAACASSRLSHRSRPRLLRIYAFPWRPQRNSDSSLSYPEMLRKPAARPPVRAAGRSTFENCAANRNEGNYLRVVL